MKNGILTIMRKELARFFGDKRLLMGILLPGIMIYVLYSFMGQAMGTMFGVEEDYEPRVCAVNLPASIDGLSRSAGINISQITPEQLEEMKEFVTSQSMDLLVEFPADFEAAVTAYDSTSGLPAPQVAVYYNSASTESQAVYRTVVGLLDAYESQLSNRFDVNAGGESYDLATQEDAAGTYFAMLLPMLLMMFLYSGCIAVAPESIAGEKERGTIATMLITPIRRSHIAIGKILALAIMALLSGVSSAAGTILALPKLMGAASDELSAAIYGLEDYLLLGAVILSTVLLLVTLISLLSAFAKTTKEAQTYTTPLMILVMVLGITGMFGGGATQELPLYLIPLYNSVQCMVGVFSFSTLTAGMAMTLVSNGVFTLLGVFLLTRMFNSERIVFSK